MINIELTKTFKKIFDKISHQDQLYILEKIKLLENEDENTDIKKLQPKHLGYFRLRAGKYRIIFEYSNSKEILLLKIDKRDSVYFNF